MIKKRMGKIIENLHQFDVDSIYLTNNENIRYATGFSGSAGNAILSAEVSYFLTDFRYQEQIKSEVKEYEHIVDKDMLKCLKSMDLLEKEGSIGFEADHLSVTQLAALESNFPNVEWIKTNLVVERAAAIKDEMEIENISAACKIIDEVFLYIIEVIKPGMTENEISAEITYQSKLKGSEKDPFEPIIASGWRSALPHGISTSKSIENGDLLVLDFGATVNGYVGDMTRSVVIGEPNDKQREIYAAVLGAQEAAIDASIDGITGAELDAVARAHISNLQFGEYFGHALGHGLGLNVHSWPRVSEANREQLLAGMIITIEPGIYIPDFGGVRIEDNILLTDEKSINLTGSSKEFISIG